MNNYYNFIDFLTSLLQEGKYRQTTAKLDTMSKTGIPNTSNYNSVVYRNKGKHEDDTLRVFEWTNVKWFVKVVGGTGWADDIEKGHNYVYTVNCAYNKNIITFKSGPIDLIITHTLVNNKVNIVAKRFPSFASFKQITLKELPDVLKWIKQTA